MVHILNRLKELRGNDDLLNDYINSILVSSRTDRQGLPPKMFSLLTNIQNSLNVKQKINWTY